MRSIEISEKIEIWNILKMYLEDLPKMYFENPSKLKNAF